jgi:predicted RNA-binding protein with RPS1 domain
MDIIDMPLIQLRYMELDERHIDDIHEELSEGDTITVKLTAIDEQGRLRLSKKAIEETK